jgi:hypothetical protein
MRFSLNSHIEISFHSNQRMLNGTHKRMSLSIVQKSIASLFLVYFFDGLILNFDELFHWIESMSAATLEIIFRRAIISMISCVEQFSLSSRDRPPHSWLFGCGEHRKKSHTDSHLQNMTVFPMIRHVSHTEMYWLYKFSVTSLCQSWRSKLRISLSDLCWKTTMKTSSK